MKKKILIILGCLILLSLIGTGMSQAFTVDNVDGVWGYVDGVTTTSNYYPVDIIGYARNGVRAPLRQDQGYRLKGSICAPMQNITPPWPNTARWDSVGVDWSGLGSHSSTCTNAPDLFFSEYVYAVYGGIFSRDRVAIEIVNRTGNAVELRNYKVLLFTDDRTYTTVTLNNTTLAHGGVYVLRSNNTNWDLSANQTFSRSDSYRTIVLVKDTGGTRTEGARCDRWATGPGDTPLVYSDWNPSVQTGPTDDENQVRYGRTAYRLSPTSSWQSYSCEVTDWADQSGFGFDGVNGPLTPVHMAPFLLGQFTHYNNQIYATDDSGQSNTVNPFEWVDLTITVPVTCNDGYPAVPASFTFTPHFVLEETSNSEGECKYEIDPPNDVPCPDRVTIEFPPQNPTFTCSDGTYTVNVLGFTSKGLGSDECWESYDPNAVSAAFITAEDAANHACLWARIEQPLADISVAKTCWDFDTQNPYYEITTSNLGPGSSRGVTMTDTLPSGMAYKSYTSQLITTSGTIDQGTCSRAGQTVTCSLNTPLQDYSTDLQAKWVVRIYVTYAQGSDKTNTATVSALTADPYLTNNTATATCNPSAVSIIAFDAKSAEDGVLLTWETASELNNLGFNLYRATKPVLPGLKLNFNLIPSHNPGSTSGAVYEFLDATAVPGFEYFYWLEDVDFGFNPTLYGPISVTQ